MMGTSFRKDVAKENEESYNFSVSVYNDVVVKEFKNHIRISMNDWEKFKQRLIPVLKQGETDATRNREDKKDSTPNGQGD
jgi:UDP-N-acetylglucosamine pyrophosphorylase